MAVAVKRLLSGSTDGKGITVSAVTTPGTLIHTAVSGTTAGTYDEIWLWAYNNDIVNNVLFIEWGTDTLPRKLTIALQVGLTPIIPGLILQNAMEVRIYCTVASKIVVDGFVNRITD